MNRAYQRAEPSTRVGSVAPAQQPVHLGVLAGGVDPHDLVGGEDRSPRAQDLAPGDDARRGQPGRAHGVREEDDPAVLGVADDREPRPVRAGDAVTIGLAAADAVTRPTAT